MMEKNKIILEAVKYIRENLDKKTNRSAVYIALCHIEVLANNTMTCDDCKNSNQCECAWDMYNTDGDCLASK